MGSTARITGLLGVVMLSAAMLPGTAGADEDGLLPELFERRLSALAAIDFDPWELRDEEIPERRDPAVAYEDHARGVAAATAVARAVAEEELARAELVLEAAVDHRADMEDEVEGYSISMWTLGDLGLQERFDSEAERARQGRPVIAVTQALIARVEAADAAIVEAVAVVDAVSIVLAERVAADDDARQELREATQIRERFEAMVVARDLKIDRLTDELLTEERPEVSLVTLTSITVQVPIGSGGEEAAGPATLAATEEDGSATEPPSPAPPPPTTVSIAPIVVNAEIATRVQALIGAARSDGIDLHGAGFRPREDQITLRIAHCGTSGFDIFDRPAGECTPPTARPGESEHELGLAIDFTENGEILTWSSPGYDWMVANAGSFGLINLPSEAWHWSTTGS